TDEDEFESLIRPMLMPTRPPRKLSEVPLTGPDELTRTRSAVFTPANPPTMLFAPVAVTAPEAVESLIVPSRLPAAKPPSTVLAPPVTLPVAPDPVICPWFPLTNPPAVPPSVTETLPPAKLFAIVPPLLPLLPANPPTLLWPLTLPNA